MHRKSCSISIMTNFVVIGFMRKLSVYQRCSFVIEEPSVPYRSASLIRVATGGMRDMKKAILSF